MNNRIKRVYVATENNRVIFISTGLSDFVRSMKALLTGVKSYSYYVMLFKDQDLIEHVDMLGKKYYFQKYSNKN